MDRASLPRERSSFVGRRRDLEMLRELVGRSQLVTISGAPGIGKTRLALRLAHDRASAYEDGAAFIDLAVLKHGDGVAAYVAQQLGVEEAGSAWVEDALAVALQARHLLLVMDNCEHVIDAAAALCSSLLDRCERLSIVATSREPLRLPGEALWQANPLELSEKATGVTGLRGVESVALFTERAHEVRPDFVLTDDNIGSVKEICRRLDGMPLAIELAAALVSFLAPPQIAAGLDDALGVLVRGNRLTARHRSLRAALDWSLSLLDKEHRALLERLSVFAGSFDAAAARAVAQDADAGSASVDTLLLDLVEKSLVQVVSQAGGTRFRLLEPVRQYAAELLGDRDEAPRRALLLHLMASAEAAEPQLMSGRRDACIESIEADRHNILDALAWGLRPEADADAHDAAARLAAALFWYWNVAGGAAEGLKWLRLAQSFATSLPQETLARVLYAGGEIAWLIGFEADGREWLTASAALWRGLGDGRRVGYCLQALSFLVEPETGRGMADEAMELFETAGDRFGYSMALHTKGMIESQRGAPSAGRDYLNRGLALYQELGESWLSVQVLNNLGDLDRNEGRYEAARANYETALSLVNQSRYSNAGASLVQNLGFVWLHLNDAPAAANSFRDAVKLFVAQADRRGIAESLAGLAAALLTAQPETAARLLGASSRLLDETNATQWRSNRDDLDRTAATLNATLGATRFDALVRAGRALSLSETLREAQGTPAAAVGTLAPAHSALTRRELEVARLVARGFTNRRIAQELVISEGTAGLHVKHILRRLQFSSRAQVAAWAVASGLTNAAETGR